MFKMPQEGWICLCGVRGPGRAFGRRLRARLRARLPWSPRNPTPRRPVAVAVGARRTFPEPLATLGWMPIPLSRPSAQSSDRSPHSKTGPRGEAGLDSYGDLLQPLRKGVLEGLCLPRMKPRWLTRDFQPVAQMQDRSIETLMNRCDRRQGDVVSGTATFEDDELVNSQNQVRPPPGLGRAPEQVASKSHQHERGFAHVRVSPEDNPAVTSAPRPANRSTRASPERYCSSWFICIMQSSTQPPTSPEIPIHPEQ